MEESVYSPADILEIVKYRKWTLIIPIVLIIFITGMIALLLPSYYQSSSTILIEEQEIPPDYVMTTITSYIEKRLQTINQMIMSTASLLDIIKRFNLYSEMQDKYTIEEIVTKMRDDIQMTPIDAEVIDRRTGRPTSATIAFSLTYQGKDPNTVYQVMNVLTSLYLEENLKIREKQARETSTFLEAELEKVKSDLVEIDQELTQLKEEHVNELPELMEVNLQGLSGIERSMDALNERLRMVRERQISLETEIAAVSSDETDMNKKRLDELKLLLTQLKTDFSEYYPDVVRVKKEINALEKQLKASSNSRSDVSKYKPDNPLYMTLSSQLSGVKSELQSILLNLDGLEARKQEYQKRIEAGPKVEEVYNKLSMTRNNTQLKLNDLMAKHMEAKIAEGLEKGQKGERFTLIEPPRVPEKPFKPNRMVILIIGFILSIGVGLGAAVMEEMMDSSIRKASTLESQTQYPVLAVIPEIVNEEDIRKVQRRRVIVIGILILSLVAGALVFHFFVMDFDVFWAKLARKTMR